MKELGIDPKLLLAQLINFAILVFVLKKFLYKPVIAMLEKRKKEIDEGLKLSEKMKDEEEKLEDKHRKVIETARKEAKEIVEEAKKQAKGQTKEIIERAHKEAADIIEKAKEQVIISRKGSEKELREEAVNMAVAMIKRVVPISLSVEEHRKILAKQIKDLETVKTQAN